MINNIEKQFPMISVIVPVYNGEKYTSEFTINAAFSNGKKVVIESNIIPGDIAKESFIRSGKMKTFGYILDKPEFVRYKIKLTKSKII
jgi:hypothetical protein